MFMRIISSIKELVTVAYRVGTCLLPIHLRRKRMTQQEFAIRLGKTKQTVTRYCKNQQIMSYETAYNASIILGCEMSELYEFVRVRE